MSAVNHREPDLSPADLTAMGAAIFGRPPEDFDGIVLIGVPSCYGEPPMMLSNAPSDEALKAMLAHVLYCLLKEGLERLAGA